MDEKLHFISDWQSRRMMQAYKSNQSPILYLFMWNENSGSTYPPLPAARLPVSPGQANITQLFFNVLCKSCGEITEAWSPPFITDGKPFQRD